MSKPFILYIFVLFLGVWFLSCNPVHTKTLTATSKWKIPKSTLERQKEFIKLFKIDKERDLVRKALKKLNQLAQKMAVGSKTGAKTLSNIKQKNPKISNIEKLKKKLDGPLYKGPQSQWIKDLYKDLRNKPLNSILIPGSRDSFSHELTTKKSPHTGKTIQKVYNFLKGYPPKLINLIVSWWAQSQSNGVVGQLLDGVRYFDIQVCQDKEEISKTRKLKLCHSLYGGILENYLDELSNFMKFVGKKEILILNFSHFSSMDEKMHKYLFNTLQSKFGNLIANSNKLSPASKVKQFIRLGQRVIILYSHSGTVSDSKGLLWSQDFVQSKSAHVQDSASLYSKLKQQLSERSKTDVNFFITPAFITPTIQTIIKGLLSEPSSLLQASNMVNPIIVNWISSNGLPANKMNIVLLNNENKHLLSAMISKNSYKQNNVK